MARMGDGYFTFREEITPTGSHMIACRLYLNAREIAWGMGFTRRDAMTACRNLAETRGQLKAYDNAKAIENA